MDPAFVLQPGEHPGAGDVGDHFLEPTDIVGIGADNLDLPALLRREPLVHPQQIGGEQRRFIAPGPAADFQHRRARIGRIARQHGHGQRMFGLGQPGVEFGEFLSGHRLHFRIGQHGRQPGDLGAQARNRCGSLGHRLQLGIVTAGRDEFRAFQLARPQPGLQLGKAARDLEQAGVAYRHTAPLVIPAQAGTQPEQIVSRSGVCLPRFWVPACAGMTEW